MFSVRYTYRSNSDDRDLSRCYIIYAAKDLSRVCKRSTVLVEHDKTPLFSLAPILSPKS